MADPVTADPVMADLVLPQLGETVTEGTIIRWFKGVGDSIALGEMIYEVSTEKVDSEVPSPMEGVITEIRVPEGETVGVGAVLAVVNLPGGTQTSAPAVPDANIDATEAAPPQPLPPEPLSPEPSLVVQAPVVQAPLSVIAPVAAPTTASALGANAAHESGSHGGGRLLSPVVRRLVRDHGLDPAGLTGTGVDGRITRSDVLNAIDERQRVATATGVTAGASAASTGPAAPANPATARSALPAAGSVLPAAGSVLPAAGPAVPPPVAAAAAGGWTDGDSRFEAFNNVRRRTGEHMVHSVAASPHAFTIVEVDYENVDQVRRTHRASWRASEGFSLTYLPFIVVAVTDALGHWPRLNASVEEGGLRLWRRRNVGVAVDLDYDGLIVPVLRDADSLSLRGIARNINELAARAHTKRLTPDDITGGTFTISNNGSFGTYSTAAIINQPQVAVLSTDGIARRPVVDTDRFGNESIVIHPVGHLAMGWDHRAFDGSYAAGFLGHVRQMLEQHDWGAEF